MSATGGERSRISTYLRLIREDHNCTQADLANALQISRQTYSHYETMRIIPSTNTLYKISKYYKDVSVEVLVKLALMDSCDRGGAAESQSEYIDDIRSVEKECSLVSEKDQKDDYDMALQKFIMSMDNEKLSRGELDGREVLFYYDNLDDENKDIVKKLLKRLYLTQNK